MSQGVGVPVVESMRKEVRCMIQPMVITTGQHATAECSAGGVGDAAADDGSGGGAGDGVGVPAWVGVAAGAGPFAVEWEGWRGAG